MERVEQLPHVAWPGVRQEKISCASRKFLLLVAWFGCGFTVHLFEKMVDEQAKVAGSLSKRRNLEDRYGQAIEEVLAEAPGRDLFGERTVCGGDDADVDLHAACSHPRRTTSPS